MGLYFQFRDVGCINYLRDRLFSSAVEEGRSSVSPAVDEKPRFVPRVLLATETVAGSPDDAEGESCVNPRADLTTVLFPFPRKGVGERLHDLLSCWMQGGLIIGQR